MGRFNGSTSSTACFLFIFFITIIFFPSHNVAEGDGDGDGDGGQNNVDTNKNEMPSVTVMLRDTLALLSRSQISNWDIVKSFLNQMQMLFSPPNLE